MSRFFASLLGFGLRHGLSNGGAPGRLASPLVVVAAALWLAGWPCPLSPALLWPSGLYLSVGLVGT